MTPLSEQGRAILERLPEGRFATSGSVGAEIVRHAPTDPIEVPERVTVYRSVVYDATKCLGCGACARACPVQAIDALPPTGA